MILCNECGGVIEKGLRFCTMCGGPVGASLQPPRPTDKPSEANIPVSPPAFDHFEKPHAASSLKDGTIVQTPAADRTEPLHRAYRAPLLAGVVVLSSIGIAAALMSSASNRSPRIDSIEISSTQVHAGHAVTMTARAIDPDGDGLTYEWSTSAGQITGEGVSVTLDTSSVDVSAGQSDIRVFLNVADGRGGRASVDRPITVLPVGGLQVPGGTPPPAVSLEADKTNDGSVQSDTETVHVVPVRPSNWPPTVTLRAARSAVYQGDEVEVFADATDRDGDSLSYHWSLSDGVLTGSGARVMLRTSDANPGQVEVQVRVADARGQTAADKVTISVAPRPNRAPTITGVEPDRRSVIRGDRVGITAHATDPDSDPLQYTWYSSAGEIRGNGPAATLDTSTIDIHSGSVQVTVSLTVRDSKGAVDSRNAVVTIIKERIETGPGPLSVSVSPDGDASIITISGRPGRTSSGFGSITVFVSASGTGQAAGALPPGPVRLDFGSMENISRDRISFAETSSPSNGYSRIRVRIRLKDSRKPVRFTINWNIR